MIYTDTAGRSWVDDPVVQQDADGLSVVFTTAAMDVDRPYVYRMAGQWYAAIRRADDRIEMFAFEEPWYLRLLRPLRRRFR